MLDLVYGDNLITWQHPVAPPKSKAGGSYFRIRVEDTVTGGYGLSEKIEFSTEVVDKLSSKTNKNVSDSFIVKVLNFRRLNSGSIFNMSRMMVVVDSSSQKPEILVLE